MKSKKASVVGVYGVGEDFTTGQAVKCYEIINWLKDKYGEHQINVVNTYKWKTHPIKLFLSMVLAFKNSKNVIIMPAQHGLKVFAPLSYILKKIYHRPVHYIVIGGWLDDVIKENYYLKKCILSFDGIYVETKDMQKKLQKSNIESVFYMPNCRKLTEIQKSELHKEKILRVCTYSRVIKEKGILDAIEIVKVANQKLGKKKFHLDIYGKISNEFEPELKRTIETNREIVNYCGIRNSDQGAETLIDYFALLFPTYYEGEGFAGTILDAFVGKTPVIANDWKYNSEIIENGKNGFIYPYRNIEKAAQCLVFLYTNPDIYQKVQEECERSAHEFSTDVVLNCFNQYLS